MELGHFTTSAVTLIVNHSLITSFLAAMVNYSAAVDEMGDSLATTDMGRKWGGGLCPPFWGERALGPHVTQCGLGRGLLLTKWHLDS